MGKIKELDSHVINMIAAGEVVENPASVVKELIENSIDAGANRISIEFKRGGLESITITDNGCGMSAEDALMAFKRHATSKIELSEHLEAIKSLGFRGEALASISEVSEVELYTCDGEDVGTHIIIKGGEVILNKSVGWNKGTTIVVRNIFYNVPARLKFLRSVRSECANIIEVCVKYILARSDVGFKVINNGKTEFESYPNNDIKAALRSVYGKDILSEVIPFSGEKGSVSVYGFLGKPSFCRNTRKHQSFFVNGRYVKSAVITRAIDLAYKNITMVGKFPLVVLYMSIPYDKVDVNVHPQKTDVRFALPNDILNSLYEIIFSAITPRDTVKELSISNEGVTQSTPAQSFRRSDNAGKYEYPRVEISVTDTVPVNIHRDITYNDCSISSGGMVIDEPKAKKEAGDATFVISEAPVVIDITPKNNVSEPVISEKKDDTTTDFYAKEEAEVNYFENKPTNNAIKESKADILTQEVNSYKRGAILQEEFVTERSFLSDVKVRGSIFDSYLIAEYGDKMLIIDQHAAHERLLFDKYTSQFESKDIPVQQLLSSVVCDLPSSIIQTVTENIDVFASLGYDVEEFGEKSVIIRGVPSLFGVKAPEALFEEIAYEIEESGSGRSALNNEVSSAIIKASCKLAVKANMSLSKQQIDEILRAYDSNAMLTCPHGRPIVLAMDKKEIEKYFGRRK
ncbi:MAG: DNA mismatch repair endonuclease MutL [Clostridiales bacterium]|nr:DNA mismatch repair endonuclease MutL [Clostridiales bacterium]